MAEPSHRTLRSSVLGLASELARHMGRPFAFFGHSLGALIAFELARLLEREVGRSPAALFVSGQRAPHKPPRRPQIHTLSDTALLEQLRRLEGTPPEIMENWELMQLMLPTLRADFTMCETYVHTPGPVLNCPVSVFGGLSDADVRPDELLAWRAHTTGSFSLRLFPGGHFFVQTAERAVLKAIASDVAALTPSQRAECPSRTEPNVTRSFP